MPPQSTQRRKSTEKPSKDVEGRRRSSTQLTSKEVAPPPGEGRHKSIQLPAKDVGKRRKSSSQLSSKKVEEGVRRGAIEFNVDDVKEIKNVAMVRAIYSEARKKKNKEGIEKLNLSQAFRLVKEGSRAMVLSKGISSLLSVAKEQRKQEETDAANFVEEVEELKRSMSAGEHFEDMIGSLISIVTKAFGMDEELARQFKEALLQVSNSLASLTEKLNFAKRDHAELMAFIASIQDSFKIIGVDMQKLIADVHKANLAVGRANLDPPHAKHSGTPTPENSDVSEDSSDDVSEVLGAKQTCGDPKQAAGSKTSLRKRKKDIMKTIRHRKAFCNDSIFSESKSKTADHVTQSLMEALGDFVQHQVSQEIQEQVVEADIGDVVEIMASKWHTAKNKLRAASILHTNRKTFGLSDLVAASTLDLAPIAPDEDRPLTDRPFRMAPPVGWTTGHRETSIITLGGGQTGGFELVQTLGQTLGQTGGQQFRQTGGFELGQTLCLPAVRATTPKVVDRWTEVKKQAVSARGIESVMVDRSQRKGLIRGLGLRQPGVQRPPFPITQAWQSEENSRLMFHFSRHSSKFEIDGMHALATSATEELTAYSLSHQHLDVPARQRCAKLPELP